MISVTKGYKKVTKHYKKVTNVIRNLKIQKEVKDMTKKIKHLVAIGAVSIITLGATVPASAQTINRQSTCKVHKSSCSVKFGNKKSNCNLNDCGTNDCESNHGNSGSCDLNKILTPEKLLNNIVILSGKTCNNNTAKPEQTPSETPSVPGDSNDNNTVVPEEKPEQKPSETPSVPGDSNNNTTKPEEKPEQKPEEKPEQNPGTSSDYAAFQQRVLELVNSERAKVGAKPLTLNAKLSNVATTKSQDMIDKNYFDHNSPTYGSPFDMMKKFGISYKSAGENIAMGQTSPEEVMKAWMNSDGHRKNILNSSFTEIGVGVAKNAKGQLYWTQMFIGN